MPRNIRDRNKLPSYLQVHLQDKKNKTEKETLNGKTMQGVKSYKTQG